MFTNEVLYAINAINEMSLYENKTCLSVANSIGAPYEFLQRILMTLGKAGIIHVKKGPGGGFSSSQERLETVTVLDVLAALGHNVMESSGNRASDRLNNALYDTLNVTLVEFLS